MATMESNVMPTVAMGKAIVFSKVIVNFGHGAGADGVAELTITGTAVPASGSTGASAALLPAQDLVASDETEGDDFCRVFDLPMTPVLDIRYSIANSEYLTHLYSMYLVTKHGTRIKVA